jgi:IclR family pca regulon transcriptional regulator
MKYKKNKYDKTRINSLTRCFNILKCFNSEETTLRLVDISSKLNISNATIFRYLATLEDLGFLEKDKKFKGYRLTVKVLELGYTALKGIGITDIAQPYLEKLAHCCKESASIAVLDGFYIVYVGRSATRRWMSTNLLIGSKLPAYCSSLGMAILAYKPVEELEKLFVGHKLIKYTPYTVTDLGDYKRKLEIIKKNGYSINNQELEIGLLSAAAPIFDAEGEVFSAINISMPSSRVSIAELKKKFIPFLLSTANELSNALNYK